MNYTLITRTGKIYTFYVKACAETYLSAYGGSLVDNTILEIPLVEVLH
jgi:hypothetical protein